MNEIKISTPAEVYEPAKVLYDFTELDTEIQEIEKRYKNWIPSECEIKDAEKVVKEINGIAKNLNDEKVKIKKDMNKESKSFEDDTMLRINQLKAVRQNIINNLDVYEQKRINEIKENIESYLDVYCDEIGFTVPLEKVYESRMTNKSCSEKEWKDTIKRKVDSYKLDFDLLAQMNVEDTALLQSIFTQKWDRLNAINEYDAQIEANKRADEIRKQKKSQVISESVSSIVNNIPFDVKKTDDKPIIKTEMVCIKGELITYLKCKDYAIFLGLSWEEL